MRRSIGFFSVMVALGMFVLGTGCSSGVTSPPEPSSPLLAVWLADRWEITDLSDPDRIARSWSIGCQPFTLCTVFWLSATQDSFFIGTTTPPRTLRNLLGDPVVVWTPRDLNQGSLALQGTRATLTGAGPPNGDERLPIVWEAMLEGNVLTIEGTGTWNFSGENQLGPARMVVRLRRCPDRWMNGSHGGKGSWCTGFSV